MVEKNIKFKHKLDNDILQKKLSLWLEKHAHETIDASCDATMKTLYNILNTLDFIPDKIKACLQLSLSVTIAARLLQACEQRASKIEDIITGFNFTLEGSNSKLKLQLIKED